MEHLPTKRQRKIYIAGHRGMVGSALVRALKKSDHTLITMDRDKLDLTEQDAVENFFKTQRPDEVYLAAAKVGGIYANHKYPAEFIYQNLMIASNVIHAAFCCDVKKLLFIGSSCIYPKDTPQPIDERELLSGALEPTNAPYAVAKIAGLTLIESYNRQYAHLGLDWRSIMPCNLYGPGDNYHQQNSHVIPALIRRFHEAKINQKPAVTLWGTGTAQREFLHVDDLAQACLFIMNLEQKQLNAHLTPNRYHVNAGSAKEITILKLAELIKKIVNYSGQILFDTTKPDGTKRKVMQNTIMKNLGWRAQINLEQGLKQTYKLFLRDFQP